MVIKLKVQVNLLRSSNLDRWQICSHLNCKDANYLIWKSLSIKYVHKKIGLTLGVTTDLVFEISKQNLISKLLTFIRKIWSTVRSDILSWSRNMGKNVKKIKSKKNSFRKKICQKNCQVLPIRLFLCKVTESIL